MTDSEKETQPQSKMLSRSFFILVSHVALRQSFWAIVESLGETSILTRHWNMDWMQLNQMQDPGERFEWKII